MMYMPDAIRATLELMQAPLSALTVRGSYNLAAMSLTPRELAAAITRYLQAFTIDYAPDARQAIADSWPGVIDDSTARRDWGWDHHYELAATTKDMLQHLAFEVQAEPGRFF
jgi:nucleoside-diphosphate-sugar epimerase